MRSAEAQAPRKEDKRNVENIEHEERYALSQGDEIIPGHSNHENCHQHAHDRITEEGQPVHFCRPGLRQHYPCHHADGDEVRGAKEFAHGQRQVVRLQN